MSKYPRTYHFETSPGRSSDDKVQFEISNLIGNEIVISEKLDGSNFCLTNNGCFARSHSGSPTHPSFDLGKRLHAEVKHLIPEGIQIFGEYCYAIHSIAYESLPSYFFMFGVRDLLTQKWIHYDEVTRWATELMIPMVPKLYRGVCQTKLELDKVMTPLIMDGEDRNRSVFGGPREGIVCRVANSFDDDEFIRNVVKWVRPNHVTSDEHWAHKKIVPQTLR